MASRVTRELVMLTDTGAALGAVGVGVVVPLARRHSISNCSWYTAQLYHAEICDVGDARVVADGVVGRFGTCANRTVVARR
jgi:hypothetical protein